MQAQIDILINQVHELQQKNTDLEKRIKRLEKDGKPESFYQKYLEKKYSASHTVNLYGVTDIETDDSVIEIKEWKNYKSVIGQIMSYTVFNNKKRIVYCFGDRPSKMADIVRLFEKYDIELYHIYTTQEGNVIEVKLTRDIEAIPNEFIVFIEESIKKGTMLSSISVGQVLDTFDINAPPLQRKKNKDIFERVFGKAIDGRWKGLVFTCIPAVDRQSTNRDIIIELLVDNYASGEKNDYVLLTNIRKLIKQNGVYQDDQSIKKLVEETFDEVEFKDRSTVSKNRIRNFFLGLKMKNL